MPHLIVDRSLNRIPQPDNLLMNHSNKTHTTQALTLIGSLHFCIKYYYSLVKVTLVLRLTEMKFSLVILLHRHVGMNVQCTKIPF